MNELEMSQVLSYLSLGLIVLGTFGLARSKRRNPFIWGGVTLLSLVFILVYNWSPLLAMGPMILLLFIRPPRRVAEEPAPQSVNCPKCHALHAPGHSFCVNCGWELSQPFTEETAPPPEPAVAPTPEPEQPEPVVLQETATPPPPVVEETPPAPTPEPAHTPAAETLRVEEDVEPVEPALTPQPAVPRLSFRQRITPAGFTERGLELFNQGKFQEAIDQFTKAIAIDPGYLPAWARRSEAYERLGLNGKAEEDRKQADGLQGHALG